MQKIKKRLLELSKTKIKVGVLGGKYPQSNVNVAEVAIFNEYGTSSIPARPFLRSTMHQNDYFRADCKKLINKVLHGKSPKGEVEKIGIKASEAVKKTIIEKKDPSNAQSTIKKKGFDNPLIDTKRLLHSIDFKVVKK